MDMPAATPRLKLRMFDMADAPHIARLCGDYGVASMIGGAPHPYPLLAAELWVLTARAAFGRKPKHDFAVESGDGELAGAMTVFKRGPDAEWELGYWTGRPYWGRGYATEAGRAVMNWARSALGASRMVACHNDDNPASGRVLQKLGFCYTGGEKRLYSIVRGARVRLLDMVADYS
ncbi:MAG: GNAT family N-acetyltransferase [Maricaulaceae bacterium]|nr:GNAT family N-acetyltransferase [Maricaulaceae bacterium]